MAGCYFQAAGADDAPASAHGQCSCGPKAPPSLDVLVKVCSRGEWLTPDPCGTWQAPSWRVRSHDPHDADFILPQPQRLHFRCSIMLNMSV